MADKLVVTTQTPHSDIFSPALPKAKESSEHTDRRIENSSISTGGSSVAVRDGNINIAANQYTQTKYDTNGTIEDISFQRVIEANRLNMNTDEIIVNNHIFNNKLYELTDLKQVTTSTLTTGIVGNFCMFGTVLVKAWEPDLKRYVFIRRPVRMPMFSPAVSPDKVMSGVDLTDPLQAQVQINGVMNKATASGATTSDAAKQAQTNGSTEKLDSNEAAIDGANKNTDTQKSGETT
jgi:hypothetical protein